MALSYKVRYIVTMEYTKERQESDRAFLVGVNYGRGAERERIARAIEAEYATRTDSGDTMLSVGLTIAAKIARGEPL